MQSISVSDETYLKLRVMSRSTGESINDSIDRLLREWLDEDPPDSGSARRPAPEPDDTPPPTSPSSGAAEDRFAKVHALYMNSRVGGVFDAHTHSLRITTGPLAGKEYPSPSQAAIAVVESLNPGRANSNTNGRIFWHVDATGKPLRSLIGKR